VSGELEIIEIAPGISLEHDVLRHMSFRPRVASDLKLMDKRLFSPAPMNLRADTDAKARSDGQPKQGIRRVG
jgi:propionate CoA-transferase